MNFTKLQSAGNDFVLVKTSDMQRDWSQLAIAICDRHFGVGADGLLLLLPSDIADFGMRILNSDGSEAEVCGNGLGCLARYILDKELANIEADEISIETISGIKRARVYKVGSEKARIQIGMGMPKLAGKDIPVKVQENDRGLVDIKPLMSYSVTVGNRALTLNLVSMGNPHAIYFYQESVSEFPLSQIGPRVEHLEIFPNRINFEVAKIVNRQQIEARVWERGVGETLACGSGACAIAVAAQLHGYIDTKVDIKLPGGVLEIEWDRVGEIFLGTPAKEVFSGEWIKEER